MAAIWDATNLGQHASNETSKSVAGRVPTLIGKKDETGKPSTVDGGKNQSTCIDNRTVFSQLASPF